jgi:hypothetical protein
MNALFGAAFIDAILQQFFSLLFIYISHFFSPSLTQFQLGSFVRALFGICVKGNVCALFFQLPFAVYCSPLV